ncbi:MAG: alpha-D-ribose 1-methylphosphonate 5-triphosphate diphosphatase [Desulfatirhabdiaceae bacterium]
METRFTNARIVTRNDIVRGSLVVKNGCILEIDDMRSSGVKTIDLQDDLLLPGLIEIHTDNLEKNILPRPGVLWPSMLASALAHDVQIAGAGITTVFDAIAIGGLREGGLDSRILKESIAAIVRGQSLNLFKADHRLHLRCDVADKQMESHLSTYGVHPLVNLISVMDHTPGQRQWTDLEKWRLYHRDKKWTDPEAERIRLGCLDMQRIYGKKNRVIAVQFARNRKIPLASHDDTTAIDAVSAAADGIAISEFPTTLIAAEAARSHGMRIVMGAPNVVRGGSHSGNISAGELAKQALLDGLSSDYVPVSLLHSAFYLSNVLSIPLPKTVAMISANVADMTGLDDRGEIAVGKRADLIRVTWIDDLPVVRKVWREGQPIC